MANTPEIINPVGNPIKLNITSTNIFDQYPVYAKLSMTLNQAFNVGDSMELSLFDKTLHFDFVEIPDNSGFQIRGWDSNVGGFVIWWPLFIDGLKANYYLNNYFSILDDVNNQVVNIAAKDVGPVYNINWKDGVVPGAISAWNATLGVDTILKANFGIHARVVDAATGLRLGEDRIAGMEVSFDFHEYMKAWAYSNIYFPDNVGQTPTVWDKAIREFYIETWEKAGDYVSKVTKSKNYKAICGGINKTHEQLIDARVTDYLQLFNSGDILVQTARPINSYISINQPLHFYVINNLEKTVSFFADIDILYTDDTSINITSNPNVNVGEWDQLPLLLSPYLPDIANASSKTIKQLTITIKTTDGEESQGFILKVISSPQEQILCVKNSFGTYDYIPFFGISEIPDKYNRITFENSNKEISLIDVSENEQRILNSGWVSKEVRDWYRDLLQSREVFLINGDVLEPFIITTGESLRHKDQEYLYGLVVKLQRQVSDSYYSRERNPIPNGGDTGFVIGTDDYIIGNDDIDIGF